MDSPVADEKEGGRPTKKTQGDRPFTKRDREKFITRQPPIGEKDDYDNENKQKTVKTNLSSKNQTGPVVIGISRDHHLYRPHVQAWLSWSERGTVNP